MSGKHTRIPVWYFLNLNNKPVSVPKENIFDTVHSFLQANTHEYSGKKCSVYIMYYYITILNGCIYNFIIAKTSCFVTFSLTIGDLYKLKVNYLKKNLMFLITYDID